MKYLLPKLRQHTSLSRSIIVLVAALVIAIGFQLARAENVPAAFLGAFLAVSGAQVLLWAFGIRLELLGNTGTENFVSKNITSKNWTNLTSRSTEFTMGRISLRPKRGWNQLKSFLFLCVLVLSWAGSIYLSKQSDVLMLKNPSSVLPTVFDVSSLAVFILPLLLIGLGLFRWQVDEAIDARLGLFEAETRGRTLEAIGYMMGEASIDAAGSLVRDREKLKEAVAWCQQGYELLKTVGGPAEFLALNNLVFYSCVLNDRSRRDFLLKSGRLLLEVGQEKNATNLILTGCRAILQYGRELEERRNALEVVAAVAEDPVLTPREKTEARYLMKFGEHRAARVGEVGTADGAR